MTTQPKVGIVILTYNSEQYIENCLKSVFKNTYSNTLCVIVDNNSADQTTNIVKKKFSKIKIIKNKINLGYAAGNNVGIRFLLKNINVSYILILNPDTLVSSSLISETIKILQNQKATGIVGSVITYAQNPHQIWFAGGYLNRLFLYTKHPYMNKYLHNSKIQSGTTDFITGACMMVKKEVFKKIGLLPEEYFMYFEDVDFCQKAIEAGYTCRLLAKPLVKHYVSASSGKIGTNDLTPLRAYYYARNPFIYIKKNVRGWKKITNYLGQLLIRLPYFEMQILLSRNMISFISYIKGIYNGMFLKF